MAEVILHHYPQSPVTEKVRVGLGVKGLAWRSVLIPRIPPKPDLMPLTGGYRRTPVLQVGADIYCDSQCILRELERRFPEPSFMPGSTKGMPWAVSRWTDGPMLDLAVSIVLGADPDSLPPEFAADRGRLYFGPDHDLKALQADMAHILAQMRTQLGWLEQRLETGRDYLLGDKPALPDALSYYIVWFLRGRWPGADDFLAEFPNLEAWERRLAELGHGSPSDLEALAALEIAREAEPETPEGVDPRDPQGFQLGEQVAVVPLGDGGDPTVTGQLHLLNRDSVAVLHEEERVGTVCVHFPRAGYRVSPA